MSKNNHDSIPIIHIGLCLAGAVSAGTYTAGVIDYLLETLERWEVAKREFPNDPRIPRHKVVIEVITGASAGGIAGGFLILQNNKKFEVFEKGNKTKLDPKWFKKTIEDGGSIQYDAWVNLIDGEDNLDMMEHLLKIDDLETHSGASLLNSKFFDKLTQKFIGDIEYNSSNNKTYISENLEFATSISNLDGIGSFITFNQGKGNPKISGETSDKYLTSTAKDLAHFQIVKDRSSTPSEGQIPLKVDKDSINTKIFGDSLMATSAFPIGFKPRFLYRDGKYMKNNPLLSNSNIDTNFKEGEEFKTLNVDGGMVNNEPFEIAAYILQRSVKKISDEDKFNIQKVVLDYTNENKASNCKSHFSTILMVDPFPTESNTKSENHKGKIDLLESALKILKALRMQPLVKSVDINIATNKNDYSRFMLAPRRKIMNKNGLFDIKNGSLAIASGVLGGFGGFIDKEIREHDYELGRFNCQHYIQKLFGIKVDDIDENSIFHNIYKFEEMDFLIHQKDSVFPFIPDLVIDGSSIVLNKINDYTPGNGKNINAPIYPSYPKFTLDDLNSKFLKWDVSLKKRIKLIISHIVGKFTLTFIAKIASSVYCNKFKEKIISKVKSEFDDHELLK